MLPAPSVQFKVVFLGDTGVGKSCLLTRFVTNSYRDDSEPTLGASFMSKLVTVDDHEVKFNIWDTAGQERYHALAKMYYRDASAAILVFDLTQPKSFHNLKNWLHELHDHGPKNLLIAVAANKEDKLESQDTLSDTAKRWAEDISAIYRRTSAKTNYGVEQLFKSIAQQLLAGTAGVIPPGKKGTTQLKTEPIERRKGKCCG